MASTWRKILRRFHPEGIPWPPSILYNTIAKSKIFRRHFQLVAEDVARYCPEGRVLDVGTGPGWLLLALHEALPDARIVGVDISSAMVSRARKNIDEAGCSDRVEVKEGEAGALRFPDDSFDAVVSTGSLHHWKEPLAGLNEIHRVIKPGGHALVYDLVRKIPPAVRENVKRSFGGVRLAILWLHSFEEPFYSAEEMEALAGQSRFRQGESRFVGALCCLALKKESVDSPNTEMRQR